MPLSLQEQYDKIHRYCYFKVKNRHLAEDLTQETFLRFFAHNRYINKGKPLAYLYAIARNLCVDAFRKGSEQPLPEDAAAPDAAIAAVETAVSVKQAVAVLPEELQELLLLRFANSLSMKEISGITGLSRFALRRKIDGARAQLKQLLREEDYV